MIQNLQHTAGPTDGPLLYVAELIHRILNEYAATISLASLAAARTPHQETRAALNGVIGRLHALAGVHQVMRPSLRDGPIDLADHVSQLCEAMVSAGIGDRGISVNPIVPGPILLDAVRCWRMGLIIAELITNASRHAFGSGGGKITAALWVGPDRIICEVSDDGSPSAPFAPGLGTRLVHALAEEVEAQVERRSGSDGTTVKLSFRPDGEPSPALSLAEAGGCEMVIAWKGNTTPELRQASARRRS